PGPALPRLLRAGERQTDDGDRAAGDGTLAGLSLARQRARAGERHRARGGAVDRLRPRGRPPVQRRAAPGGDGHAAGEPGVHRHRLPRRRHGVRAPSHHQGAAVLRRGAEAGGGAAAGQAHHAPRDDEAAEHLVRERRLLLKGAPGSLSVTPKRGEERGSKMSRRFVIVLAALASVALLVPAYSAAEAPAKGVTAAPPAPAAAPRLVAPLSAGELPELPPVDPAVPTSESALGYPLGTRFTHWDRIVAYLQSLAAASNRVKMWEYGQTYEGRPLKLVAFASSENLARLDAIREERLRLADPAALSHEERERLVAHLPVVVWLAYGVHGNEASSSEAAMAVAYLLAAGQGDIPGLLKNMIVLVDPLSNPDGRERYVHSFEERRGADPNPRATAAEHWEPWPGGRQNHYLIDLNRDWAWASQEESRSRLAAYRAWEPQVYVDFHEMASESSYFFLHAAEPINPRIDHRILPWLETFGRANAAAFDHQGWVYYKAESYDLFYPGYGDSYPSLRGAVGMTYEMAGGGRGGLALTLPDGTLLTLADRVAHHLTTSLAPLRTAAANGRRLLADFTAHRAGTPPES